jgi:hypothetical protein
MTVRGSSTSFDSRASRARLDRAFLGFLIVNWPSIFPNPRRNENENKHYAKHVLEVQLQYVVSGVMGQTKQKPDVRRTGL